MQISETCFLVQGLTVSDCASWVQAWGTVLAILGAFGVAAYQARSQHQSALRVFTEQQTRQRRDHLDSLTAVARAALDHFDYTHEQTKTIALLVKVANDDVYFDYGATRYLDDSIQRISLVGMPAELIPPARLLTDTFRQYRRNIDLIPVECKRMDEDDYIHFSSTMAKIREVLQNALAKFEAAAHRST